MGCQDKSGPGKIHEVILVYKHGREVELGTTDGEQIQLAVRARLEHRASELQVQRSNRSATLPPPINRALIIAIA